MSNTTKGLGRGLDALFGGSEKTTKDAEAGAASLLPIALLRANPNQPRRHFDQESLRELADSIKTQGIIQPLLVRPQEQGGSYQIVAGERRWRAAKLAGLTEVPVYIRQLTDKEVMAAALIENLQREDLNPVEEAQALQALREALELTQEELAARLGKSRPAIANALRLLQLSDKAQEDLAAGRMSAGHARCLLSIDDSGVMEELRQRIQSHALTVRDTEDAVTYWKEAHCLPWQAEEKPTVTAGTQAAGRRKKSAQIRMLQKSLSQYLNCKAVVSGTEEKGKITLSYHSQDELVQLLRQLGVELATEGHTEAEQVQ